MKSKRLFNGGTNALSRSKFRNFLNILHSQVSSGLVRRRRLLELLGICGICSRGDEREYYDRTEIRWGVYRFESVICGELPYPHW